MSDFDYGMIILGIFALIFVAGIVFGVAGKEIFTAYQVWCSS